MLLDVGAPVASSSLGVSPESFLATNSDYSPGAFSFDDSRKEEKKCILLLLSKAKEGKTSRLDELEIRVEELEAQNKVMAERLVALEGLEQRASPDQRACRDSIFTTI